MTDRDFPRQHPQNLLFPGQRNRPLARRRHSLAQGRRSGPRRAVAFRFAANARHQFAVSDAIRRTMRPGNPCSVRDWLLDFDQPCRTCAAPACPVRGSQAGSRASPAAWIRPTCKPRWRDCIERISLTALEDLAQCRFKFFGGRTLALKGAPERPGERLTPRVTGSILHVALERWLADRGRDFVELFEATFDEMCRTEHLPAGYRLEVERIAVPRDRPARQRERFVDAGFVRGRSRYSRSSSPAGSRSTCRIDRIDIFAKATASSSITRAARPRTCRNWLPASTRLQGPLYALAVREHLNLNPVAMIYWAVREDERFGWGKIPGTDLELQPMPENWAERRPRAHHRTAVRLPAGRSQRASRKKPNNAAGAIFRNACRVEQQTLVDDRRRRSGA